MRIGIDIGGVIIGGNGDDTFFDDEKEYFEAPEVRGAIDTIYLLHSRMHELHIVSKCGKKVERKSLLWLRYNSVDRYIPWHRVHFVRKRHLKAPMAQALELDIFIDDRQDIIDSLEGIVKHRILFTSWEETNNELVRILDTP